MTKTLIYNQAKDFGLRLLFFVVTEAGVYRYSEKFREFYRKSSVLKSLFNKAAGLKACDFIKKGVQHGCVPVKFAKSLRRSLFIDNLWWLLLHILSKLWS